MLLSCPLENLLDEPEVALLLDGLVSSCDQRFQMQPLRQAQLAVLFLDVEQTDKLCGVSFGQAQIKSLINRSVRMMRSRLLPSPFLPLPLPRPLSLSRSLLHSGSLFRYLHSVSFVLLSEFRSYSQ